MHNYYWISDTQVYNHKINEYDLRNSRYDTIRLGYWIPYDSMDATRVSLKGVRLIKERIKINDSNKFIQRPTRSNDARRIAVPFIENRKKS